MQLCDVAQKCGTIMLTSSFNAQYMTTEKFNFLGKFTTDRHIPQGYSSISAIQVYAAPKSCFLSRFGLKTDIDFDHYGPESGMVAKRTTRAYKRMENGMFGSEIGLGFKEPGGTPPPRIPRSTLPRRELPLSNISFDTHARINEIKSQWKESTAQ